MQILNEPAPMTRDQARRLFKDLRTLITGISYPPKSLFKKALASLIRTWLQARGERLTQAKFHRTLKTLDQYAVRGRSDEASWFKNALKLHSRSVIESEPEVLDLFEAIRGAPTETLPNGLSFFPVAAFGTLITGQNDSTVYLTDGYFTHAFVDVYELQDFLSDAWDQCRQIEAKNSSMTDKPFLVKEDAMEIAEEWSREVDEYFADREVRQKFLND